MIFKYCVSNSLEIIHKRQQKITLQSIFNKIMSIYIPIEIKKHILFFIFSLKNLNEYYENSNVLQNKETFLWGLQFRLVDKEFKQVSDQLINELNNELLKNNNVNQMSDFSNDLDEFQLKLLKNKKIFQKFYPKRKRLIIKVCSEDTNFLIYLENQTQDVCLRLLKLYYNAKTIALKYNSFFFKRETRQNRNPFHSIRNISKDILVQSINYRNSSSKGKDNLNMFHQYRNSNKNLFIKQIDDHLCLFDYDTIWKRKHDPCNENKSSKDINEKLNELSFLLKNDEQCTKEKFMFNKPINPHEKNQLKKLKSDIMYFKQINQKTLKIYNFVIDQMDMMMEMMDFLNNKI